MFDKGERPQSALRTIEAARVRNIASRLRRFLIRDIVGIRVEYGSKQAQPGVAEIRIPSERAFRERTRRRVEGIVVDRAVIAALQAL